MPKFQMVSGGFDILSHIMEIYFSGPDDDNVSDDIAEALMRNVIRNLRAAIADPGNYTARSNLMWDATRWNISLERTRTVTMERGWQYCIRCITVISARRAQRSSSGLP